MSAMLESQKYLSKNAANDGGYDPGRYEVGTDLSLIAKSEGLVGWWTFDEGSGTTAYDASGNGNNGTWNGTGSHFTGGKVGTYAGQFNGVDDYIEIPSTNSLSIGSNKISYSAWVNPLAADYRTVFSKGYDATDGGYSLRITRDSEPIKAFAEVHASGTTGAAGVYNNIANNIWSYLTGTYDGTQLCLYVNGVLNACTNYSGNIQTNNLSLRIGRLSTAQIINAYFKGLVDEVRIYNRVLSAAEIQAIYNATK